MEVGLSDNTGNAWRIYDSATQRMVLPSVNGNNNRVGGNPVELATAEKNLNEKERPDSGFGLKRAGQESENETIEDDSSEPIPLSSGGSIRDVLGASVQDSTNSEDLDMDTGEDPSDASGEASESEEGSELTEEEQDQIEELKERDQEVRQHEQAHLAAAGSLANGGAQYEFQSGPDGKNYAIGGNVSIDTSPESSPQATISKARQIQRAALAPADPSPQDIKVAAQAMQMMMGAQRELAEERTEKTSKDEDSEDSISLTEEAVGISNSNSSSQQASGKLEL